MKPMTVINIEKAIKEFQVINKLDLDLIDIYSKQNNLNVKIYNTDITKEKDFPKADIALCLKIFDVIDLKNHKPSEELIKKLNLAERI